MEKLESFIDISRLNEIIGKIFDNSDSKNLDIKICNEETKYDQILGNSEINQYEPISSFFNIKFKQDFVDYELTMEFQTSNQVKILCIDSLLLKSNSQKEQQEKTIIMLLFSVRIDKNVINLDFIKINNNKCKAQRVNKFVNPPSIQMSQIDMITPKLYFVKTSSVAQFLQTSEAMSFENVNQTPSMDTKSNLNNQLMIQNHRDFTFYLTFNRIRDIKNEDYLKFNNQDHFNNQLTLRIFQNEKMYSYLIYSQFDKNKIAISNSCQNSDSPFDFKTTNYQFDDYEIKYITSIYIKQKDESFKIIEYESLVNSKKKTNSQNSFIRDETKRILRYKKNKTIHNIELNNYQDIIDQTEVLDAIKNMSEIKAKDIDKINLEMLSLFDIDYYFNKIFEASNTEEDFSVQRNSLLFPIEHLNEEYRMTKFKDFQAEKEKLLVNTYQSQYKSQNKVITDIQYFMEKYNISESSFDNMVENPVQINEYEIQKSKVLNWHRQTAAFLYQLQSTNTILQDFNTQLESSKTQYLLKDKMYQIMNEQNIIITELINMVEQLQKLKNQFGQTILDYNKKSTKKVEREKLLLSPSQINYYINDNRDKMKCKLEVEN